MRDKSESDRRVLIWREFWLNGSETFVRRHVNVLREWKGFAVGVSRRESPISSSEDMLIASGSSMAARARRWLFRTTRRSRRLNAIMNSVNPDIIHAHFLTDATLIHPTARRLDVPLVVTIHGYDIFAADSRRNLRRKSDLYADDSVRFLAVSEAVERRLLAHGVPSNRVQVHYLGIEVQSSSQPNGPSGEIDVLFVGRLVEKKGVDDLLAAIGLLASKGRRLSVAVVGDGYLAPRYVSVVRDSNLPVSFLGTLSPQEVTEVMLQAKMVAVPSKTSSTGDQEGLPTVAMEALALGIPVVGTWHSGIPEIVENELTGLLSPEGDAGELANNIGRLLDSAELREEMGRAGQSVIRQRFDATAQGAALEAIYRSISIPRSG